MDWNMDFLQMWFVILQSFRINSDIYWIVFEMCFNGNCWLFYWNEEHVASHMSSNVCVCVICVFNSHISSLYFISFHSTIMLFSFFRYQRVSYCRKAIIKQTNRYICAHIFFFSGKNWRKICVDTTSLCVYTIFFHLLSFFFTHSHLFWYLFLFLFSTR